MRNITLVILFLLLFTVPGVTGCSHPKGFESVRELTKEEQGKIIALAETSRWATNKSSLYETQLGWVGFMWAGENIGQSRFVSYPKDSEDTSRFAHQALEGYKNLLPGAWMIIGAPPTEASLYLAVDLETGTVYHLFTVAHLPFTQ